MPYLPSMRFLSFIPSMPAMPSMPQIPGLGSGPIGEYIREQRHNAEISLRELAERAGISNPYLSQVERGLRKPSAEILQQLAKALRVSAESLYVRAGILDDRSGEPEVTTAIRADRGLTDRQRRVLLDIYEAFQHENAAVAQAAEPRAADSPPAEPRAADSPPAEPRAADSPPAEPRAADSRGASRTAAGASPSRAPADVWAEATAAAPPASTRPSTHTRTIRPAPSRKTVEDGPTRREATGRGVSGHSAVSRPRRTAKSSGAGRPDGGGQVADAGGQVADAGGQAESGTSSPEE